MKSRCATVCLGLAVVVPACWTPAPPVQTATWSLTSQQNRVEARIEIRQLLRDLTLAESTGNLEALRMLYGLEARWMPPDGPVIRGRDAILQRYEELFAEMEVSLDLTSESVSVSLETGQVLGWAEVSHTPRAGGQPEILVHRFRLVVERDSERAWRIRYLEWRPWEDLGVPEDDPEADS